MTLPAFERIRAEEIKQLTESKKEIYQEAKGNSYDVKILREAIRVRKQDQKERRKRKKADASYVGDAPHVARCGERRDDPRRAVAAGA